MGNPERPADLKQQHANPQFSFSDKKATHIFLFGKRIGFKLSKYPSTPTYIKILKIKCVHLQYYDANRAWPVFNIYKIWTWRSSKMRRKKWWKLKRIRASWAAVIGCRKRAGELLIKHVWREACRMEEVPRDLLIVWPHFFSSLHLFWNNTTNRIAHPLCFICFCYIRNQTRLKCHVIWFRRGGAWMEQWTEGTEQARAQEGPMCYKANNTTQQGHKMFTK